MYASSRRILILMNLTLLALLVACAPAAESTTSDSEPVPTASEVTDSEPETEPEPTAETDPVPEPEEQPKEFDWDVELVDVDADNYKIHVLLDGNLIREVRRVKEGGIMPSIQESFDARVCDHSATVFVLVSSVSTGVSGGSLFDNLVLDKKDGAVITTIHGADVQDRQDGSAISDTQDELIEKLRADEYDGDECESDL